MRKKLFTGFLVVFLLSDANGQEDNADKFISTSGGVGFGLTQKESKYTYLTMSFDFQVQGGSNHALLFSLQPTITTKKVGKTVHLLNTIIAYNYQFNPSEKIGLYAGGGTAYSNGKYLEGKIAGDGVFKKITEYNYRSDFEWGLYANTGVHFHGESAGFNIRLFAIINSSSQLGCSLIMTFGNLMK